MTKVPVLEYIPQRPPFVLVDNMLECDDERILTEFVVPETHVLVQAGQLTAPGVMENIAQTCATRIGWVNRGNPVRIGVIGSISHLEIDFLPKVGQTLLTEVKVVSQVFDATIIHATCSCDGKRVAECDMKVFLV